MSQCLYQLSITKTWRNRRLTVISYSPRQPCHSSEAGPQGQLDRGEKCVAGRSEDRPLHVAKATTHKTWTLAHSGQIHAAVHVEDVAGDVGGFVGGEEEDGRGDIAAGTHATEGNADFQFFFYFVGEDVGHGRGDEAGGDGVDCDVARSDFHSDGFGEADDAGLGGDVIDLACVAHLRDDGGDVDDASSAGPHHDGKRLLDAEMSAGEIGAEDGVPVVGFHADSEAVAGDGGVVDEDVEAREFFEDGLEADFDLVEVGDVHFDSEGFPALSGELLDEGGEFFFVARGDGDLGAGFGEGQGGVAANALGGAGDEGYFVFQGEHFCSVLFVAKFFERLTGLKTGRYIR